MINIEDKIRTNLDQFNNAEPPAGHFARFSEKLNQFESITKHPVIFRFSFIWRAAAAVLVLFAIAILYNQIDEFALAKTRQDKDIPNELLIATNYYARLNQQKITEIEKLASRNPEKAEIATLALQEVQAFNENSERLKKIYIHTKDEREINAIITNYRMLGNLLDHIIYHVNKTV